MSVLDSPDLYRLAQSWLAPGAEDALCGRLAGWLNDTYADGWVLDVGCGPGSLVTKVGCRRVIGVDLSARRASAVRRSNGVSIRATAAQLPFADGQFDAVWSGGLLHHLADDIARAVVSEIMRVTRPGGHAVTFDSVLPEPAWRRPLAWAVRRLDRGRYVRTQVALEALLPQRRTWACERFTYARNGLEGLWCSYRKEDVACSTRATASG